MFISSKFLCLVAANKFYLGMLLVDFFFSFPDLVAQRGEKLELLIDKTDNLVDSVSSTTVYHVIVACKRKKGC